MPRFEVPSWLNHTVKTFIEIIWPGQSLLNRNIVTGEPLVDAQSWQNLRFITDPVCKVCGDPLIHDLGKPIRCAACIAKPPAYDRARAPLIYDDISRQLVFHLKRAGRRDGLPAMRNWMMQAGHDLINNSDIIIPVPLHYFRLVQRGFNQSAWLARAISKASGLELCVDGLIRTKNTPTQGRLTSKARKANLRGAFKPRTSRIAKISGKRILLIDDVLTTGATINACARALRKANADEINVLSVIKVVRDS